MQAAARRRGTKGLTGCGRSSGGVHADPTAPAPATAGHQVEDVFLSGVQESGIVLGWNGPFPLEAGPKSITVRNLRNDFGRIGNVVRMKSTNR
jgi:hypothetical protein